MSFWFYCTVVMGVTYVGGDTLIGVTERVCCAGAAGSCALGSTDAPGGTFFFLGAQPVVSA